MNGRAVTVFLAGVILIGLALTGFVLKGGFNASLAPQASLDDARQAAASNTAPAPQEWNRLEEEAAAGNPVAMNNLGVALWRSKGKGKAAAQVWFEKAAQKGDVAARYNLALSLPDKFETDPEIIQRRLALLGANVEAGDVPSMVALAQSLYYVNRSDYVPDREGAARLLLRRAAATGDSDYSVIYGNWLWKDVRGDGPATLLDEAIPALLRAYDQGDPRGAETLGDILASGDPRLTGPIAASGIPQDALLWYRRAGEMGLATARCHHGLHLFRTGDWIRNPDMSLIERHFRAGPAVLGNPPEVVAQAIDDLKYCATDPKRARPPNPPFGAPSLYAYKLRGTWTSMVNSPGWANLTLGILYGYGIGVDRDADKAREYLIVAAEKHKFPIAKEVQDSLPDF